MYKLFIILSSFALIMFIVSMIKPRWGTFGKCPDWTRKRLAALYVIVFVMCSVFASAIMPEDVKQQYEEQRIAREQKAEEEAKQKAETEKQKVEEAAAKKAAEDQQVKEAFQAWNNNVTSYLQTVDNDWEQLWKNTLNDVSNQSMDIYTAYNNIDKLDQRLLDTRKQFMHLETPTGLSKEQEDALNQAKSDYEAWIYCRRQACEEMKDMLNTGSFPPAKMKEVTDNISQGDAFLINASAAVVNIQKELGLLESK